MKHFAFCGLAICALTTAHASERVKPVLSGCENMQSAAAVQPQSNTRSAAQSPGGLVTHRGGSVAHNTGQVVHRGGNVIHNTGQVVHNTPLLNRPAPTYRVVPCDQ